MSAKTATREEKIIRLLLNRGAVAMEDLLQLLNTPAPSIRRDLQRLESNGLIRRTHGGAELAGPLLYEPFRYDSAFCKSELRSADQKRRIAAAAADMVQADETVGITAGATSTQVGRALRRRAGIRVVTNAVNVGMELCNMPGLRCSLTGGVLAHSWSFSLTGPAAIRFVEDFFLDRLILNVVGIDAGGGCTTVEQDEALTFRSMVRQSKQVIVVADSAKLGRVSTAVICPIEKVHVLVTDRGATETVLEPFRSAGVRVLTV